MIYFEHLAEASSHFRLGVEISSRLHCAGRGRNILSFRAMPRAD